MAVNITATRTSSLFNDQDGDGVFDTGDIVLTKIRVTNAGTTDATGISVTDSLNGVTLVPGSVEVTPIAFDDLMPSIVGNTPITYTAAQLLGNDVDPDGAEINLTISGVSNASNGAIVNNGDGTFTFTPTTGFVGTASFQYTITDEQTHASVTTGIVSFTVTDPVWYVNNATGSDVTGDGSYAKPFATLAPLSTGGSADALDNANDTIFVYNAGTYNSGIVLETGQKLFGDGHVFSVNGLNIGANGSNTTINHSGIGVTLSTDNTILGVTVNGTANGAVGVQDGGGTVGTFTMDESSITGLGKSADITHGGTLAVDLDQMSSGSSTTEGIHLQGVTGSFNAATGIIQTSTGTGVLIGAAGGATASSGGDVNFTYGGDISSPGGSIVEIQDRTGGTVTFSGTITEGAINAGQTGILADGNAGTINFNGQTFVSAGAGTGNGVTLTNNTGTINFAAAGTGLDITTTSGTGLTFTGGGTLNITNATNSVVTGTGQILNLQNGTMGTNGIAFQTLTSGTVGAAGGNAININNLDAAGAGTFSGGAVTIGGTAGASADGINITSSNSTFSFASATIDNTAGDGIEINGQTQTQGAVTFTTVNLDGMAGVGVNIAGASNAVNINGGSIGSTNDPANDGIKVNGGTGAVTVAATVNQSSGGNQAVDISGHSGGAVSFTGAVTAGLGGGGISLTNNTGGNITFSGDVSLTTGTLNAFTFTNTAGTGANVTLSSGTTDITTTSGTGINATNSTIGAGSLTISGASNTVAASTGRAINVDGVTLNSTLLSVGVSGGGTTTGVWLQNTGGGGQFIVTGTGSTAGSGGTITNIGGGDAGSITAQPTTGTGIYMNNVSNVSLSNMIFGQVGGTMNNFGIRGDNVNNFTLTDSEFRGVFGTNFNFDEATIRFGSQNVTTGLTGTALFQGNVIGGGIEDNLSVYVYGSNTLNITVKDSANDQAVFNNNDTTNGNDDLYIESGGTSTLTALVDGVNFNGARGDLLQVLSTGSTHQTITIQNDTFNNQHPNIISGGGGLTINGGGTNIDIDYLINNNTFKGMRASAIFSSFGGVSGNISGLITNNTMGTANGVYDTSQANRGSMEGMFFFGGVDAKQLGSTGNVNYAVKIDGNTIRDVNGIAGILLRSNQQDSGGQARVEATISNNTMAEMGPNIAGGIYMQPGGASLNNDKGTMGANISNNNINFTIGGASASGDAVVFDQAGVPASFYMPGYTSAPSADPNTLATFLKNTKGNVFVNAQVSGTGGVLANTSAVQNQAFVLTVPSAMAPGFSQGWQDLPHSPVTPPPSDPDPSTPDTSGGGGTSSGGGSGSGGTGGTGGSGGTGGGSGDPPPTVVNDNVLTVAELNTLVDAAIQRWIDAGATAAQVDAMRAVQFGVVDMAGIYVGTSNHGVINIDVDGAGYGWFVDSTPGEDSEFDGSGSRLTADSGGGAEGKLDLLTVLMHELGHQIGLDDVYVTSKGDDVMFGYMSVGERRLPTDGEASGAVPGSIGSTAFALTPVSIGTLPTNKTFDIFFRATIDAQTDKFISPLSNDSTISGSNFSNVIAHEDNVVDSLTLGDTVYLDANKNNQFDAGEGLSGVSVSLYADTNDSGGWDVGDLLLGTQTTLAGGLYSFVGLAPGDYIVVVNASNFGAGQVLENKLSGTGVADPDDNVNNDDNGLSGVAGLGAGIASKTITLSYNNEGPNFVPGAGTAGDDTNNTLDFGFFTPNAAPVLNNVDGNIGSFIEGGAVTRLDVASDAALSDSQANFNNGTLTVHIGTGLATGEDQLVIDPASGITVNGSNHVLIGGVTDIGTVSGGGAGGGDLVFTFNSAATPALVQTLIRGLGYNNSNTVDPSTDTRSISMTLVDGGGTDGGAGTDTTVVNVLVNVTGVNDAPSGAATANDTTNDTTTLVFDETNFNTGFSDPDHNAFAGIVISDLPATGTLKLNGTAIVVGDLPVTVTLAQLTGGALTFVPTAATGGTSVDFHFAVYDDGGVLNSGVDTDQSPGLFTVNITPSNIAPVVDLDGAGGTADFASSYTEGGAPAAIGDTDVTITDADAGDDIVSATITITNAVTGDKLNVGTLPITVSVDPSSTDTLVKLVAAPGTSAADFEAAIEAVTFSNTGNNPTALGTNTSRSITVTVNDGDSNSAAATATVTVTDDNADAPSGTNATISATEDVFRLFSASDFGTVDGDGVFAKVTLSAVTGGAIYFDSDGTAGAGTPSPVGLPQTYTAQDLIDGKVLFKASQDLNGNGVGTVTFTVIDDDNNADPSANTLTVNVTPTNDSPVIPDSPTVATNEQTAVKINAALAVSDVDLDALNGGNGDYGGTSFGIGQAVPSADDTFSFNTTGASFTVVGNTLKVGGNTIATFGVAGGALTISFTSANGTVASKALVNNVLSHIQYTNLSDTPPASVTLTYQFDDGAPGNAGQGALTAPLGNLDGGQVTVNLTAVNDAPVNSVGLAAATNEDTAVVLDGISISDVDALPASVMTVTLSVAHGTLVINTGVGGGITGANITGGANGTNTIVIQATQAEINATLADAAGLTYTPAQDYNGADALTVTTNDGGATGIDPLLTGNATSEQDQDSKTINIAPQDDAPVAQPDAVSTPENVTGTGSLFADHGSGADTDIDGPALSISAVAGGTVGVPFMLSSGAILQVNANGTYSYNPNGKFNTLTDNTSGAVNTSTVGDTFQYTLTGGNTVTVTVTVNGVAGPGDWLMGDATDNTITGTPQKDLFLLQQGGDDTVYGLASDDIFYFGGAFTGADKVDGDGGGKDVIVLQGNYNLTLSATNLTGVESISLQSGANTFFGDTANNFYDYDITTVDANVALGQQLIVNGQSLRAGEDFTFDGSAEHNGKYLVFGGHGVDTLTGGDGNDVFVFEGDRWGASDSVDGGLGRDAVVITAGNGTTHIDFGATSLIGVESVTVANQYSSTPAATPDYEFVLDNGNVAAGATLIVNGFTLTDPGQTISIDGSNVQDGKLILFGGAGADTLIGGDQNDTLYGAGGVDSLTGGAGNDVFRYDSIADSSGPASQDTIQDFNLGDLIDLSHIDANSVLGGNQAFSFIGGAAFSGTAGELRFENISAGGTLWAIQGDTDGINGADFEIHVIIPDLNPITSGDFIL
jgi:hypothetical protein